MPEPAGNRRKRRRPVRRRPMPRPRGRYGHTCDGFLLSAHAGIAAGTAHGEGERAYSLVAMTAERWRTLKPILTAALERATADRAPFLDVACGGDAIMRAEIESLLSYRDVAD